MTAVLDDPFAEEIASGPPRDRYKRPLIRPVDGGELEPYTRASTLAGYVCDKSAIDSWEQTLLAIGLGLSEDLCALIAALPPLNDLKVSKDSLTREQKRQDKDTKEKLNEYKEAAKDVAGRWYKARYGSAVHGFIEQAVTDETTSIWAKPPERMKPDVDSAIAAFARHKVEVLAVERFVVQDELQCAGSFDYLVRHPRFGVCIADCKTGSIHAMEHATQFAVYSSGVLYDWDDETRAPLESLTGGERVNADIGLLVHVPLGSAKTSLFPINVKRGIETAKLAVKVRDERKFPDFIGPELVAS
jgi:hypothetical protein